jgi:hypothetical protein
MFDLVANITETLPAGRKARFGTQTPLLEAELQTEAISCY